MPVMLQDSRSVSASLADTLRHKILERKFSPREPLPSLRALSDRYRVGIQVVRSALSVLEEEGLVYRLERRGTFVRIDSDERDATTSVATPLKCINFIERASGTTPGFVRSGYLQGYTEVLEQLDVKMRILPCPEEDEGWDRLFSQNYPFREQGCILINVLSAPMMRWLDQRGVAFVAQNNKAHDLTAYPPHHSVCINKVRGGFDAASHLIERGHRRIGFVGQSPPDAVGMHDVYEGVLAAMSCHGLHARSNYIVDLSTNEPAMAVEPMLKFLRQPDHPTGIVTQNDAIALAVVEACRRLKLCVPDDLSVVGFDDLPEAARCDPPLTTVSNPRVQLGRSAVEMLVEASAGKYGEAQVRILEGCLVVRESTASPCTAPSFDGL